MFFSTIGKTAWNWCGTLCHGHFLCRRLHQDLPEEAAREIVYQVYYIGAKSTNIVMLIAYSPGWSLPSAVLHAD